MVNQAIRFESLKRDKSQDVPTEVEKKREESLKEAKERGWEMG